MFQFKVICVKDIQYLDGQFKETLSELETALNQGWELISITPMGGGTNSLDSGIASTHKAIAILKKSI
jgi:hypothetical protein